MTTDLALPWIAVERDGDRTRIRTSDDFVRRRRRSIRAVAVAAAVLSLSLGVVTPWAFVLSAAFVAGAVFAPRSIRSVAYVDVGPDDVVGLRAPSAGRRVPRVAIRELAGAYEVHGWNPYTTIYAVVENGERIPLAVFSGADESLPEQTCRALGRLIGRSAVFVGQYGEPRRWLDSTPAVE